MDNDIFQILKWVFLIVVVFIVMWFLLQIVQELDSEDIGFIDLGRIFARIA